MWHPVTPAMNKLGYDAPDACQDVRARKGAITSFFKPKAPAGGGAGKASSGSKATNITAGDLGGTGPASGRPALAAAAPAGAEPTINTDADSRGQVAADLHPHKRPPSPIAQAGGKRPKVEPGSSA